LTTIRERDRLHKKNEGEMMYSELDPRDKPFMHYPKIHNLFKREGKTLIEGTYAQPEFSAINTWTVTEKIDGMNVRILYDKTGPEPRVFFGGRTDAAIMPDHLLNFLAQTFTIDRLERAFADSNYTVIFGEGYGPKIQNGSNYRRDVSFILFDIFCSGWWLDAFTVAEIAKTLEIDSVPILGSGWPVDQIVDYVKGLPNSVEAKAKAVEMEGVVARSEPVMLFRKGGPIMFKLKCADMRGK
jgi:ATP-dependent RNA circularization protein (DNA/RNA ligase family)